MAIMKTLLKKKKIMSPSFSSACPFCSQCFTMVKSSDLLNILGNELGKER